MRRFLIKSIGFVGILALYFAGNTLINLYLMNKERVDLEGRTTLILGDSHPQRSIDPKLMANAVNVCQSAEPLMVSYWKLRALEKQNPIDTVLLGLAPHNLSTFNDLKFSDARWAEEMFRRTYPISHFERLNDRLEIHRPTRWKVLWKHLGFFPDREHVHYMGGFAPLQGSNLSNWKDPIERHYFDNGNELHVSDLQLQYLDSVVQFCRSRNIRLILTSHPLHPSYLNHIPPQFVEAFRRVSSRTDTPAMVFDRMEHVYPDSLFNNTDHLNSYGATRFTNELKQWLAEQANGATH